MDRPIIFSAPMVLAMLQGRKTMTRRLLYTLRKARARGTDVFCYTRDPATGKVSAYQPPLGRFDLDPKQEWALSGWQTAKAGDRLWVRETIRNSGDGYAKWGADDKRVQVAVEHRAAATAWAHHEERALVPAIHMPKWASRLTLIIAATKIERLHDISNADAQAEGVIEDDGDTPGIWYIPGTGGVIKGMDPVTAATPREVFAALWRALHGRDSWDENPWVVALSFKVVHENIDLIREAA